jgi:hypothetical protein
MNGKYFLGLIVPLSVLLPIIIGLIKFKSLSAAARIIFWYVLISAVFSGASVIIGRYWHQNNMPLVHLYTIVEIILFTWYYRTLYGTAEKSKWYIILPLVFTFLCIINAIFYQSIYTYSSYTRSVEAMICILFALNYFAKLAAGTTEGRTGQQPDFYFNAGIFLFFSGAFILFVFSNFIITNTTKHNYLIIWNIHAGFILLMYIFFSTGFVLCKK